MATPKDEFDPPSAILDALISEILTPALERTSERIGRPYEARIAVWVRDTEIPKFSISPNNRGPYEIDENTDVRIRFRATIKENRYLYSIQTQHAEAWRRQQLSGVSIRGDIVVADRVPRFRVRDETICYTGGVRAW